MVNIGLIVACCFAFVYQMTLGSEVERLLFAAAFIPARLFGALPEAVAGIPDYGLPGNLLTILLSMFLHGGWLHIIGNMWFLQGALSLAAQPGLGGVAWFAHIGGFVTGVVVAWWVRARGRLRQPATRYQIWYRH